MTNQEKKLSNVLHSKVAGTTFKIFNWNDIKSGMELTWEREPTNPYDANAIKLGYTDSNGEFVQIGYINKHNAEKLAPHIDSAEPFEMNVFVTEVTGGTKGKSNQGINIEIRLGVDNSQYYNLSELYGEI